MFAMHSAKRWYHAHINRVHENGNYDVYFVEDSQLKKGLVPSYVRDVPEGVNLPHRRDMLNKVFYDDGDEDVAAGEWKVRRISDDNNYVCTRLTGGGLMAKNLLEFDVGYTMRMVRVREEDIRERGPIWSSTRRVSFLRT